MIREDQVLVVDVAVINPTWERVTLNVINQPTSAGMELNAIVNICKYRGFCEGHHFIMMAMEVHDIFGHNMDSFIKECARRFHNKRSRDHLSLYFCIQFCKQLVSITL
jgi:hypothetical protein